MCFGPGQVSMPYASIAEWLVQHVESVGPGTYFEKSYKDLVLRLPELAVVVNATVMVNLNTFNSRKIVCLSLPQQFPWIKN